MFDTLSLSTCPLFESKVYTTPHPVISLILNLIDSNNLMSIGTVEILQFIAIALVFIEGLVFGTMPKLM